MTQLPIQKPNRNGLVLALDLGTQLGFALGGVTVGGLESIIRSGRVSFPDRDPHPGRRWLRLWTHLDALYDEGPPVLVVLEDFVGGLRTGPTGKAFTTRAPIVYGGFRAIVEAWSCNRGIPVRVVNPTQLKKAATGYGRANKDQMSEAAARRWRVPLATVGDDNAADAMCLLGAWLDGIV